MKPCILRAVRGHLAQPAFASSVKGKPFVTACNRFIYIELLKKQPDFDSRYFGYPKLSVIFESLEDLYIIEKRAMERAQVLQIFVRRN